MASAAGSPQRQQSQDDEYDVVTVEEINKRQLGKVILKYCGHEGTTDDEQTASLRRLLQRAITNIEPQLKEYPGVWRDAELKIFDLYGNGYVVRSGQGSVKFVAQITGNGDAELSMIKDESWWASMKALVTRQNNPQLQIEGAPSTQGSDSRRWLSFSWPFSSSQSDQSHAGGLSPDMTSESPSQMENGNTSEDGVVITDEQHQDQQLSGHDQGEGSQNNELCHSNTFGDSDRPQQVGSERQIGATIKEDGQKQGGPTGCGDCSVG